MKKRSPIIFSVAAILLACDTAAHGQPAVWITDSLAKVQPNATPGTASFLNIFAARNEFESFQVHVQAGSVPISLSVSVTDFVNNADGSKISANPNVAVFREGYITVTTPSDLNCITGQVPDQLIPVQDAYFHQPRNAFPVTVPTGQTRSAWVDVYVPVTAEPGSYTASAKVMDGPIVIATLPVNLKVWSFTLPSTSTLKSVFGMGFGSLGLQAYTFAGLGAYPGSGGNPVVALDLIHAAVAAFFLDHRVTLDPVVDPTYPSGNWTEFDAVYGPLISGTEPTILPGARLSVLQYANTLRPANPTDLLDWAGHFSGLRAPQQLIGYLCDEPPGGCSWSDVYNYGTASHAVAPSVPLLVTTSIGLATQNNVLSAIDILAPILEYIQPMNAPSTRPAYNTWLQLPGKQLWWYQSCDEHGTCANGVPGPLTSTWPVYTIDASPVRNRIFQWLAYLYGIQGELYYFVENWGPNPWTDVYSTGGNGDGILYYPGTVDVIGGTYPVPVASMRLKLIRDGMEDFEYLNALSQAGQSSLAASVSSTFIQNAYTFNNDPSALTSARITMGELLHGLAITPPILTSPANGGTGVSLTPVLNWTASAAATSYDVNFGTSPTPPLVTNVTATSYTPATLATGTTYYWQIIARNSGGTKASALSSFTTTTMAPRVATAALRDAAGAIRLTSYLSSTLSNSGGLFASDPSAAQDSIGNTFVTARDTFNAVWVNVYNPAGQTWGTWQLGGGVIQGVPSIAVAGATGWIASRDAYSSYWLLSYTPGSGFGTWTHLAGVFSTDPVIAACGDGSLYLVGKDNYGALWSGHYIPGSGFQGFILGGGVVQGKPSVSCGSDNAAYIAARDNYNSSWVARVSGNTWTGWFNGGAVTNIDTRIAALGGSLALVILDSTGAVYRTTFSEGAGNGWQPWISVGGVLADIAPAGVGGQLFFAGRAPSGDLYWWQQTGNQWTWIGNNSVAAGALSSAPR